MTNRRAFLMTLASAASAASVASVASCTPAGVSGPGGADVTGTRRVPLMAVGASTGIADFGPGGQGIAVTRIATDTVIAVSRRCTHAGCTVGLPAAPSGNMSCPCHGSLFTSTGAVLHGPAANPLFTFPATIDSATNEVVVVV